MVEPAGVAYDLSVLVLPPEGGLRGLAVGADRVLLVLPGGLGAVPRHERPHDLVLLEVESTGVAQGMSLIGRSTPKGCLGDAAIVTDRDGTLLLVACVRGTRGVAMQDVEALLEGGGEQGRRARRVRSAADVVLGRVRRVRGDRRDGSEGGGTVGDDSVSCELIGLVVGYLLVDEGGASLIPIEHLVDILEGVQLEDRIAQALGVEGERLQQGIGRAVRRPTGGGLVVELGESPLVRVTGSLHVEMRHPVLQCRLICSV